MIAKRNQDNEKFQNETDQSRDKDNKIATSNSREREKKKKKSVKFKQELEIEKQHYSAGEDIVATEIKSKAALELEISDFFKNFHRLRTNRT